MSSNKQNERQQIAGKSALESSAEFLKFTTTFAVGALAFSLTLISDNKVKDLQYIKFNLLISLILLTISLIAGVFVYARVPIQLQEENYDLEDIFFIIPGRVHQITLIVGIVCIGAALILMTFASPVNSKFSIQNAQDAILISKQNLPKNISLIQVEKVELIKGIDNTSKDISIIL